MSKFIPDPQIQQLRAMRAGDIAFASETSTVGVASFAALSPEAAQSVSPGTANSLETLAGTPSETGGPVGIVFNTTLSVDDAASISIGTTDAFETLAGTPSESPVVGVGTGVAVV